MSEEKVDLDINKKKVSPELKIYSHNRFSTFF
jgi:hypothetical protein